METDEKIAVVASGLEFEEILDIPIAADKTGKEVAEAELKEVERCNLNQCIIRPSFDPIAANSKILIGACLQIKSHLGHSLLWLAYRHHIHKIVLKHVFEKCCVSSN